MPALAHATRAALPETGHPPVRAATSAMGTRFELVLAGEDEPTLRAAAEEAIEEIRFLHDRLSAFSPASTVSRINRDAATAPVNIDRETFALLRLCLEVFRDSGGAFDITVGPLMRAWGFRSGACHAPTPNDPPIGAHLIELDEAECTVRFKRTGVEIDLGAVAKGYALDRAAAALRDAGVTSALLHGGTSTVVAIGAPPGTDAWRVRVRDDDAPVTVPLRDSAMSVSAPRGRTVTRDGRTVGHVLDPRTRAPVAGAEWAAAVGPDAARTDAWSTALLVLRERPRTMPESVRDIIRDAGRPDTKQDPPAGYHPQGTPPAPSPTPPFRPQGHP